MAVGIVFAYGLTFTMLPATMVWFTALGKQDVPDQTVFMQRLLDRVIAFTNTRQVYFSALLRGWHWAPQYSFRSTKPILIDSISSPMMVIYASTMIRSQRK